MEKPYRVEWRTKILAGTLPHPLAAPLQTRTHVYSRWDWCCPRSLTYRKYRPNVADSFQVSFPFSLSFLFIFLPKSFWLSFAFPYEINRFSQFLIVSLKQGMWKNANVVFKTRFVDGTSRVLRCVPGKGGDEGEENKGVSSKRPKKQRDTAIMDRTNLVGWGPSSKQAIINLLDYINFVSNDWSSMQWFQRRQFFYWCEASFFRKELTRNHVMADSTSKQGFQVHLISLLLWIPSKPIEK